MLSKQDTINAKIYFANLHPTVKNLVGKNQANDFPKHRLHFLTKFHDMVL